MKPRIFRHRGKWYVAHRLHHYYSGGDSVPWFYTWDGALHFALEQAMIDRLILSAEGSQ